MNEPENPLKKNRNRPFVLEILHMLLENKKYWMIPMLLLLFLFGLLVLASNSPLAPWILYPFW